MSSELAISATENDSIQNVVKNERKRLLGFIRKKVWSDEDAEDILQDVFYQFVYASRFMKPIEKVTSWLFTVARNKITDFHRRKKTEPFSQVLESSFENEEEESFSFLENEFLSDESESPERWFHRNNARNELELVLDSLPEEQREVFIMNELEGMSFNEISEITGESVNTLLSRKHYAVLKIRSQLQSLYNEFLNL